VEEVGAAVSQLRDDRVLFMTWHHILGFTSTATPESQKDLLTSRNTLKRMQRLGLPE
jgi:hypothetical protein